MLSQLKYKYRFSLPQLSHDLPIITPNNHLQVTITANTTKFLFTLLSFLSIFSYILANPAPQGNGSASDGQGPQTCKITGDGARHRVCPEVDDKKCPATGSYAKGTSVGFKCYVIGETVKGNIYWDRTNTGEYVSETLVESSCRSKLPKC